MADFLDYHEPRKFIASYFNGIRREIEEDFSVEAKSRRKMDEYAKDWVEQKKQTFLQAVNETEKECLENYQKNESQILSSLEGVQSEGEFLSQLKKKVFENKFVFYFKRTTDLDGVYLGKLFVLDWFIEDNDLDYIK